MPTNGLRLLLSCGLAVAAAGCQDVEPQRGLGFDPAKASSVAPGMTRQEVIAVLGEPLPNLVPPAGPGWEMLRFAEPGARWWLGEYRSNVRGEECLVWLEGGKVVNARLYNTARGPICRCSAGACPKNWAKQCQ